MSQRAQKLDFRYKRLRTTVLLVSLCLVVSCSSDASDTGPFELCETQRPECGTGCADMAAQAECVDGEWVCPEVDGACDGEACSGAVPECVLTCDDDSPTTAVCEEGEWVCPEDRLVADRCTDNCADVSPTSCFPGCGADVSVSSDCVEGEQVCTDPHFPIKKSDCPDDTCWGPPPGCYSSCLQMDADHDGCVDGRYTCEDRVAERECDLECDATVESNLPGVTVEFDMEMCSWTVYEVREGIEIPYTIIVEEYVQVAPEPLTAGQCYSTPDDDLDPLVVIGSDETRYCRCDTGSCLPPSDEFITIEPGYYDGTIEWSGRTWDGPSDTGNEPGDYFPVGEYEVTVRMAGEYEPPGDEPVAYDVEATLPFEIIE